MSVCVLKPESRGSVTLASADPTAKPVIRHNYFAAEADMQSVLGGLRAMLEISRQEAMRPFCETPHTYPDGEDEESLRAHVRRNTQTIYHPAGTCAIGSVVDPELRVLGTEALRVVDASVMPSVVRGNTNAPTIAIAERASDLIRGRAPLGRESQPAAVAP
jgi:choline dehydrogenase